MPPRIFYYDNTLYENACVAKDSKKNISYAIRWVDLLELWLDCYGSHFKQRIFLHLAIL